MVKRISRARSSFFRKRRSERTPKGVKGIVLVAFVALSTIAYSKITTEQVSTFQRSTLTVPQTFLSNWLSSSVILNHFHPQHHHQQQRSKHHWLPLQEQQCGYYMAASALPGDDGIGVFTAKDIAQGSLAQPGSDICVYATHLNQQKFQKVAPHGFGSHTWGTDVFHGFMEGPDAHAACEGFASLFNLLPQKASIPTNVLQLRTRKTTDNAGLHRRKDPGAGAITSYFGIRSHAARHIPAGSELTLGYVPKEEDEDEDNPDSNTNNENDNGQNENVSTEIATYSFVHPRKNLHVLQDEGICMDHVRVQAATAARMGRGGFAKRNLQQGLTVAPVPLQLFPDRSVFSSSVPGQPESLLVNYCFQPRHSNVLLYPYGPFVGLINHAPPEKANVGLRWSTKAFHKGYSLNLTKQEFWDTNKPGDLVMELYALTDIAEGDELFLDYGKEWQAHWEEHVEAWQPLSNAEDYVYPEEMPVDDRLRTLAEQESDPYPSNLAMVCATGNWDRPEGSTMKWKKPDHAWPDGVTYCQVLDREQVGDTIVYTVSFQLDFTEELTDFEASQSGEQTQYIDTHVPRNAISWVDRPMMSDMHLPNAFRHPIVMPDELVPDMWLREEENEVQEDEEQSSWRSFLRGTPKKPQTHKETAAVSLNDVRESRPMNTSFASQETDAISVATDPPRSNATHGFSWVAKENKLLTSSNIEDTFEREGDNNDEPFRDYFWDGDDDEVAENEEGADQSRSSNT